MSVQLDVDRVAALIREAAAEEIVPSFARLAPGDIAEKRPGDLVTATDLAMEQRLTRVLTSELPGSTVFGEEAVTLATLDHSILAGEGPIWVIDPLDGTGNFAASLPMFAVIVSLVVGGETRAGWLYDPLSDRMATAVRGEGAWMAGRRLRVSRPDDLRKLTGSIYGRRFRESEPYRKLWAIGRGPLGLVFNTRSVGQEYLARLNGGMHFGVYTRLNAWDHAAGCLLHQEAGGYLARFDGSIYRPEHHSPGILVAPDRDLWDILHRELIDPTGLKG